MTPQEFVAKWRGLLLALNLARAAKQGAVQPALLEDEAEDE